MKKSEKLVARRNAIVPEGMGMFSPATIVSGKGALIKDLMEKNILILPEVLVYSTLVIVLSQWWMPL